MKRSRACEDLVALETQKRNKTVDALDELAMSLLTRSASAEEELSRLLEAHALQHQHHQSLQLHHFEVEDPLLPHRSRLHRSDTRAVSLLEREARDAHDALAFKSSPHKSDALLPLQNSPDTTDHIFTSDDFFAPRRRRRSAADAPAFDMSAFRYVLEPHHAAA